MNLAGNIRVGKLLSAFFCVYFGSMLKLGGAL